MTSVNLKKTEELLLISNKLKQETQRLYDKTDSISNLVKKISLTSLQNEFIIASNSLLALNTTSTATKDFERNMHKLLLLILGNEVLVSEWVKKNLIK